jgi:hypothetical protein
MGLVRFFKRKYNRLFVTTLSLGVSTVETNWDQDRDFSICRDQLLKLVEIILNVETRFFFFLVEIFKIKTFQSRLSSIKIFIEAVKINQDFWDFEICQDFWRFIEISWHFQDFLRDFRLKKSWQIENSWLRNMIKLTNSW